MTASIGVYGLGVMGRNIALNLADRGHRVVAYNYTRQKAEDLAARAGPGQAITAAPSLEVLVSSLPRPRAILIMVTAGKVVDEVIDGLRPLLDNGDILIDGGNSHYVDTARRLHDLAGADVHFIGMGVSGGEEGARNGPSMMPGGSVAAWPLVRDVLRSIAARAEDGDACCDWVGEGGAGHYVKMVHNGIEYGDMQLIAETWQLLDQGLRLPPADIAGIYRDWNDGVLSSYLVDITADILRVNDPDGSLRVNNILDSAAQKGTGRWTAADALELGTPLTMITEAVHARALSARKDERLAAENVLDARPGTFDGTPEPMIEAIHDALYASKIVSYAQGFMQLRDAAAANGWNLDPGRIAQLWRAGCIIRSRFLDDIARAFARDPALPNLMLDDFFAAALQKAETGWRSAVGLAVRLGIPAPALSSALAFFDGYRSGHLPANLLQAQRDYFGAHSYQRLDAARDARFHTDWAGDQGETLLND